MYENQIADGLSTGVEMLKLSQIRKTAPFIVAPDEDQDAVRVSVATESIPKFLHNALEGLKEITLSDKERYKEALGRSSQRIWFNYFPFLLTANCTPSRSILLGEECGSLCVYLLFHWPRKNRLHLYLPPMPMHQEALDRCFERINMFNGDQSGRLWWISGVLKDEVERSGNFTLNQGDEEYIYNPALFQDLNDSNFRRLRYQLRRAERESRIDARLFTAQDKNECLQLLEKWYRNKTDKNTKEMNYFYTKACIQLFEQFSPEDLYGWVYRVDGIIRAFAFGGELIGDTGCTFLNISDHDFISIGYFARYHFLKNMQRYTTINDGGTAGIGGLMYVKNALLPTRIDAIYRGRQKRSHKIRVSAKRNLSTAINATGLVNLEALSGLKSLAIEDQEHFVRCSGQAKKKSWLAFFPFLYSFSRRARSTLYWELYRGSICLYYLSERPSGKRLSLYFPPFPFRRRTLIYAMDRVNRFNQGEDGEITWVDEGERQDIARMGYDIRRVVNEYIYSQASLDEFFTASSVNDNVATRPYRREDEGVCLDLLARWKDNYQGKGGKNPGYYFKRSCIRNASRYHSGTMIGEVLLVDGDIQGVCFAGAVDADCVSFFVTITAPEYVRLKFFQQASMARNFSALFYNNFAERDAASAPNLHEVLTPAARHQMFRARKVSGMEKRTLVREVKEINSALFIQAARELGFAVDVVSVSYSYCVISHGEKTLHVYHNATSITDVATRRVTHNKYLSQNILRTHGIPIPAAMTFSPEDGDAIRGYVEKHQPVVIKPVKGSKSVGVTVDPRNADEVRQAVARIQNDKVMVEQLIHGHSYRILLYQGRIIDVLLWLPPYVVGNGLDSLHDLVEEKNDYYRRNDMYIIQVDFEFLGGQGIDLGFVPQKGQRIFLHHSHEHYVGGEPVRIDLQAIHPDNAAMFIRVAKVSGLVLAGLDFISKDIGVAYGENGAGINEINSSPEVWPHYFCEQQEDLSAVKAILTGYFSGGDMPQTEHRSGPATMGNEKR